MVRPEVIRKRLNRLDRYLRELEKAARIKPEELLDRCLEYAGVERYLHLSIEAVNDIAGHVVSDLNLGPVDYYRDLPENFRQTELD